MGKYDDREYAVGKGKPPVAHQFKKGESGNPRGPRHRKKAKDATLERLAFEAVNEPITVSIAGRERRLPKKQAMIMALVNDALTGTATQRLKAVKALHEFRAFDLAVEDHRLTPEEEYERSVALLNAFIEEGKKDEEMKHLFADYD